MVNLSLFSQITSIISRDVFSKVVRKHNSDKHNKGIDTWTHFIAMIFCHLGQANSVRDISNGLRSITGNLSHLGCRLAPSKSSISYINQHRSFDVFRDLYYALAEDLYRLAGFGRKELAFLKRKIYLLDASVIPLSLALYDWAQFRTAKGGIKLHVLLDYDGCLPAFADLTHGKVHEINVARTLQMPKGSVVVFDMGYYDFSWWNDLDSSGIFFVTRAKDNLSFETVTEFDLEDEKDRNVQKDLNISLKGYKAKGDYPAVLRLVEYWDERNENMLTFLTNNLSWTASTVAAVYKQRWQIESFFKTIKQNLRIKSFVGTSENAVQIQVWTALITILLMTFLQLKAKYDWHMSNLISFVRLNLFVKIDLWKWLDNPFYSPQEVESKQLALFSG